jgi:hypothetical protein
MKTFTVTIINNETVAIDVEAESQEDARLIVESEHHASLLAAYPHRIIHNEYAIDEITEN